MPKPIITTEPTVKRLVLVEPTVRRIDPLEVAKALGGEPTGDKIPHAAPITLYALRAELFRRRKSSGGRPGIEGADQRVKIPVSDREWTELESLATTLSSEGVSPSAGQVASVLLSMALESVHSEPNRKQLREKLAEREGTAT